MDFRHFALIFNSVLCEAATTTGMCGAAATNEQQKCQIVLGLKGTPTERSTAQMPAIVKCSFAISVTYFCCLCCRFIFVLGSFKWKCKMFTYKRTNERGRQPNLVATPTRPQAIYAAFWKQQIVFSGPEGSQQAAASNSQSSSVVAQTLLRHRDNKPMACAPLSMQQQHRIEQRNLHLTLACLTVLVAVVLAFLY